MAKLLPNVLLRMKGVTKCIYHNSGIMIFEKDVVLSICFVFLIVDQWTPYTNTAHPAPLGLLYLNIHKHILHSTIYVFKYSWAHFNKSVWHQKTFVLMYFIGSFYCSRVKPYAIVLIFNQKLLDLDHNENFFCLKIILCIPFLW